ncbi:C40 family peptidase [Clostridium estertheticum]|uniref:C40 family peptidase n=1 Tax=Clostridium estertheticum TaxID=238834 RepID=UPI001C0D910B|nr:SH3 domain-containing protein [Clostridium estertheticum]MBU3071792.1 SH3 domain-containing protein [Clostridium estertheticum]MBU3161884.1 SH3 domain-containing protein [Clostridium estertheticum]
MYKDDYIFPTIMYSASFWMRDLTDATEIILSIDGIEKLNNNLKSIIPSLYDLANEGDTIASKPLIDLIQSYKLFTKDMFDSNGKLIPTDYFEEIIRNTNLDKINDYTTIEYGISIKKTSVRSFPIESPIFSSLEHSKINNFDRFQETSCFPFEPVLILHKSLDKKWYFVKIYNYFGWVKSNDIALAKNKKQISNYSKSKEFLMVIAKETTLTINEKDSTPITIKCGMGTKLFLLNHNQSNMMDNYVIKYPTSDISGNLIFKNATIDNTEDIINGNLPYTRYNIINQALKFIDTPYDWGDKFSGKDCSSFILTIYKCFGLLLPRNAEQQENSFANKKNSIKFKKNNSLKNRYSLMDKLKPGASLFLEGHVMMYLGKYKNTHYMIHSFSGYSIKNGSNYETRSALQVAISTIDLISTSGTPFIQKFTSAVNYQ